MSRDMQVYGLETITKDERLLWIKDKHLHK